MTASAVAIGAPLLRFCLIGQHAERAVPRVGHVGLCIDNISASSDRNVRVYDCAPPLRIGQRTADSSELVGAMRVDVSGSIELSDDERAGLDLWIEHERTRVAGRVGGALADYVIAPSSIFVRDPVSNRVVHRRFSCAGFVARAYEEGAGLVLVDESRLPLVSEAILGQTYGERFVRVARAPKLGLGLEGPGPWPVLLPGYLFHALAQNDPRRSPLIAVVEQAAFP